MASFAEEKLAKEKQFADLIVQTSNLKHTNMAKTKWVLDPMHSEVTFKVKHLMISTVTGQFTKFDATAETEEEDFTTAKVTFTVDVDSITTGNEQRDGHLKSPDFFDVPNYPKIVFVTKKYEKIDEGNFKVYGDLTIRDVTKTIVLDTEFGGIAKDPWGNTRAGFTGSGKINRKEFGLKWDAVTDSGGIVLSDEVRILVGVDFVKQAE
jgi:polyisoprenoid-binding protein YceI